MPPRYPSHSCHGSFYCTGCKIRVRELEDFVSWCVAQDYRGPKPEFIAKAEALLDQKK